MKRAILINGVFIICFLGFKTSLRAQDKKAVYVLFDTKSKETYMTDVGGWGDEIKLAKVRKYRKYETDEGIDFIIEQHGMEGVFFHWDKKTKPDTLSISFLKKISLTNHKTAERTLDEKRYILEKINDSTLVKYDVILGRYIQ